MSGVVITEIREVKGFNEVSLRGFGDLLIHQGSEEELVVEAEESLLPDIVTEVRDHRLTIEYRSMVGIDQSRRPIVYHLTMQEIRAVDISGSGSLEAENIQANQLVLGVSGSARVQIDALQAVKLAMYISGTGKVEITGASPDQEIVVSGSGHVQAWGLKSQNVKVQVSGSAGVTVRAERTLDVTISGIGTVEYFGDPKVTQNISGIGLLQNLGE
jgi:hypothetical protein